MTYYHFGGNLSYYVVKINDRLFFGQFWINLTHFFKFKDEIGKK